MLSKLIATWLAAAVCVSVAADAELSSAITKVVVYPSGASVTRSVDVALTAGPNELSFVGLVKDIRADRFQLSVDATNVDIGQVRLEEIQREQAYDDEVQKLEDAIFGVRIELSAIDDDTKAAQLQLRFLDGIAAGYAKEAWLQVTDGTANVDTWPRALTVLDEGAAQAHKRVRDAAVIRRGVSARLSKLERELQQMQSVRGASLAAKVVRANLVASSDTNVNVELTYFLSQASWQPIYQVRLNSDTGRLRLAQQAEISQYTDEDWTGVALTLSTSEPTGELERPELQPNFIRLMPDPPRRRISSNSLALATAQDAIEEVVATAAYRQRPTIGNYSVSYPIAGRTTVVNNRRDTTTVDLMQLDFNTDLITQVVPQANENAFLAARFTYQESLPLYASAMKVYVDGVYAGTTDMPTALPGAELTLPMGQDRLIDVRVEDQGGQRNVAGIIGKRQHEVTDYLFTVTNRRSKSTNVEVYDQYPVPRDNAIEVDKPRTATVPSEADLDDKPGLVVWRKTLGADEVWQIQHQYEISYPADRTVIKE